jgi:hypothetical protein
MHSPPSEPGAAVGRERWFLERRGRRATERGTNGHPRELRSSAFLISVAAASAGESSSLGCEGERRSQGDRARARRRRTR